MTEPTIDVVHIGSASRDLAEDDPRGWRLGGGASYAALTTARLGLRAGAVVGVDPAAASASEFDLLREAGVELRLVALDEGPIFRNRETPAGRVQTCLAPGRSLAVPSLPASWREAPAWSLVPVAGELGDSWASAVPARAFLSLGWQGLLRELVAGREVTRRAPGRSPLLDRADLVGVSRHDLEPGTGLAGLLRLLQPGAELVVTDGPAGGRLIHLGGDGRARTRPYAAVSANRAVDPTGAGDVFLAALVASLVRPETTGRVARRRPGVDLRFAAAAASFVVEAPGLHGVPDREAVLARLAGDQSSRPSIG
ncbi:MAG: PfkB family carbohydrate kinase [Candidatus Limnocylindrales bacterium]|nr:PfkB family carbohydrate kinase [Candidatus Limnocylindrales bacterium]